MISQTLKKQWLGFCFTCLDIYSKSETEHLDNLPKYLTLPNKHQTNVTGMTNQGKIQEFWVSSSELPNVFFFH